MKQEFIDFATEVLEMLDHQAEYFSARKRSDMTSASKILPVCKKLEGDVRRDCKNILNKLKNGEQTELF